MQVIISLWAGAVIGGWCNFLTVIYIGERSSSFSVDRMCWQECFFLSCLNMMAITFLYCRQGFVAAHTLPVLYERYDDQIDNFVYKVLDQMQNQYKKVDSGLLSKIPKGNLKKFE